MDFIEWNNFNGNKREKYINDMRHGHPVSCKQTDVSPKDINQNSYLLDHPQFKTIEEAWNHLKNNTSIFYYCDVYQPVALIITDNPAAGKSTIANILSQDKNSAQNIGGDSVLASSSQNT